VSRETRQRRGWLPELAVAVAVSLALVFFVVRPFFVEAFLITSNSMAPTLRPGDRVLANKLTYRFSDPGRGDVVAFEGSADDGQTGQVLVKRVVATSGDTVEFRDGTLRINGELYKEPYIEVGSPSGKTQEPLKVPEGSVFVMGDNRVASMDSRDYGPIPISSLRGNVSLIFWPADRFEGLPR